MRRSIRTFAVLATSALVLTACGGGSGTEKTASGDTKLTVGVIPIVDTAPIWLGKAKGFFKDEGIELKLTKTTGGAAAVPGVVNGEFDFAFGNIVSLMVAQDQGLPLEFVTNGTTTAGKTRKTVILPRPFMEPALKKAGVAMIGAGARALHLFTRPRSR